jgi:hypothetical protein
VPGSAKTLGFFKSVPETAYNVPDCQFVSFQIPQFTSTLVFRFTMLMLVHFLQIFIPIVLLSAYHLLVFKMNGRKIFIYDPTPIPCWSKKQEFKRVAQKLNMVFPYFKNAMVDLYNSKIQEWHFWDTVIMDEGMVDRDW